MKISLLITCLVSLISFAQTEKPNVLMIVFDDLNDFISPMGGHSQSQTPHFKALAKESLVFNNAHSNAPVCSPSRASFMTGVHPYSSRNYGFKNAFANKVIKNSKTLPQYMQENNYKTYSAGKIFHAKVKGVWDEVGVEVDYGPLAYNGKKTTLHPSNPAALASFGALDATYAPLSDVPNVPASANAPGHAGWVNAKWGQESAFKYNSDDDRDLLNDEKTLQWFKKKIKSIEKEGHAEPFFMALGYIRPHTPLVVPDKYFDMFPLDEIKLPTIKENDLEDTHYKSTSGNSTRGIKIFDALQTEQDALRRYTQAYLASVAFADDMLGQTMEALNKSAFKDNTIVILFSDHGYHVGEKNNVWKYTLWEDSTRVPFMIKHPKYKNNAGKVVSHPISLIDVFPTIKDLCQLSGDTRRNTAGAPLDGHSLKTFLENPNSNQWQGPKVAMTMLDSYTSKLPERQHIAVRSTDFRYIKYANGEEELYDHRRDPNEWLNLASNPEYASVKSQLQGQMKQVLTKAHAPSDNIQTSSKNEKESGEKWKGTYFKKHPKADTNKDGELSWPEFHQHKKSNK
jgi:arylsulfatase A-like enzyme